MLHVREFVDITEHAAPVEAPKRASLLRLAAWPLRVLAARRAMAQLGEMNDRELADVGLYRQDLRDAMALPFAEDPTEMFAARAKARRRGKK